MAEVKNTIKKTVKSSPRALGNSGFGVILTGGKQYKVAVGDTIKIEKMKAGGAEGKEFKEGDQIVFDKVLLVDDGKDSTNVGTPYVDNVKVSGKLLEIGRGEKVTVIKFKQKSRYFKKNGHRQPFFKVQIDKIS